MANNYKGTPIPSPLTPKSEKQTDEFGVRVAQGILGATSEYNQKRSARIAKNKMFSDGNQPIEPYLSQMGIDGKKPLTNIRFKPRPIAPKFKKVIVDGYTQRTEKIKVESLSKHIKDRKDKRKADAMFRLEYKNEIAALQKQSGIAVENPNAFVPENEIHNDIYHELNDREREELIMQQAINFTLIDNDIEKIKRKVLTECFEANMFGLYNYIDDTGRLVVDFIRSEDCVHSISYEDDFSDTTYDGRKIRMSIGELRSRWKVPYDKEESLFGLAKTYGGKYGNGHLRGEFESNWQSASTRPYDGYVVDVLHVFWKCNDEIEEGLAPMMAYEGYWIAGSDFMLQWGVAENILRAGEDREKVLSPFIFHMVDNDGRMDTRSALDFMVDSIEVMDLAILKMKQAVAKARPSGYIIDIHGLLEVDLGNGVLEPLEIAQIRSETGDTYYRSRDAQGKEIAAPIRDDIVDITTQIQGFINIYNFELENIRDYLGVNPYREGGAVPAKLGLGVMQSQLDSSNTATWSIYTAYTKSLKKLAKQIAIRIADELIHNPNPNEGLLGILGKDNADLIKERKDITASQYDLDIQLEMEQEQRQQKEQNIANALAAGTIELQDAEYVRNIDDYTLSMRYLGFFSDKRKQEKIEEQQRVIQSNAQVNMQTAQATEQAKQGTLQAELSMKQSITKDAGEQARLQNMESLAWKLIEISQTTGQPIAEMYRPIVEKVLGNLGISIEMESIVKEDALNEMEAAEAQKQQEQEDLANMTPEQQQAYMAQQQPQQ